MENRILSNIKYTIHNYSNYDISLQETKDIIDVPYFPAQNLVDIEGINLFTPNVDLWFLLEDKNGKDRVFGLVNKPDQRLMFVELADDARYLQYRFGGTSYPQGRTKYSVTTDGRKIYIGFGECNGRYVNDLWEYDIYTNTWANLNYHIQEQSINTAPSRRGKVNIVNLPSEIWIFGGETDILKINSTSNRDIIPLNDIWVFDKNTRTWKNYDKQRILPHRQGNIIYIDSSTIKILIQGGLNEIGVEEPTAIWTINRETDEVTYEAFNPPFTPAYNNIALFIDGAIHYLVNGKLWKWDNDNNQFVEVKSGITTINPSNKKYIVIYQIPKNRGDSELLGSMNITECSVYDFDGNKLSTKTITPPPAQTTIPSINIGKYQTWYLYGIVGSTFNEDMFVTTHQTLQTKKISIAETEKPQERIYPAICYDRYNGRIWLFGGTDGTRFYNDLWYYQISEGKWYKVHDNVDDSDNETYPAPRQKAGIAIVVNGDFLYLIGGYSDTQSFNDFWQYNIKTGQWQKMYLSDNIPFGSQYFIFEWRDRLYLFNGECDGVYRFFYQQKQFIKQPFVFPGGSISDTLKGLIAQRQYLETPINVKVIDDYLFIQNNQVCLKVNLEDRSVTDLTYEFGIKSGLVWLDTFKALNPINGNVIYINISQLYPLTKNQVPNSWFSKDIEIPENSGIFFKDYLNTKHLTYYDDTGKYKVDGRVLPIDKGKLLVEQNVSIVGTESDYPDVDFTNQESIWQKTIEVMAQPTTFTFQPWFFYNKNKPPLDFYKSVRKVIYDDRRKRLFLVYQSGNILKLNTNDMTMFTYYPKFWEGSVVAYNKLKGKFWCFGGLRKFYGSEQDVRTPYTQRGFKCAQIVLGDEKCKTKEMTHCGIIELDINVNELSLRSIADYQREKKVQLVDYSVTKDYLISLINKYIENYEANRTNLSIEQIKKKIYTATQSLVDDISTLDIVYEKGERPKGRAYAISTQIDNKVYIFGGAQCYIKEGMMCGFKIDNPPYFTCKPGTLEGLSEDEIEKQAKLGVIYDLEKDEWIEIAQLPEWRYLASAIPSPDNRYIYIVGGFTKENCKGCSSDIIVYDTQYNKYTKLKGIPKNFKPRALPILHWLDDYHLLIMFGFNTRLQISQDGTTGKYLHIPLDDAWILDTKNKIMYKAFESLLSIGGVAVKDYYAKTQEDELTIQRTQYYIIPIPQQNADGSIDIKVMKYDLTSGNVDILKVIPTTELLNDFKFKIVDTDDGGDFQPLS